MKLLNNHTGEFFKMPREIASFIFDVKTFNSTANLDPVQEIIKDPSLWNAFGLLTCFGIKDIDLEQIEHKEVKPESLSGDPSLLNIINFIRDNKVSVKEWEELSLEKWSSLK